jgi:alpha-ketoglutarate-dependent taurine dioxygenase
MKLQDWASVHPLRENAPPLVVEPSGERSASALSERVTRCREDLNAALTRHGALLFRGFSIDSAEDFEAVASAIEPDLKSEYLGTSPRKGLTKRVFSASELPSYYPIPQHCEMTFVKNPPRRLFFSCLIAPQNGGGETPLVDFRKVHAELDPEVRRRFVDGGIRIIRNYDGPSGGGRFDLWKLKRWDEMFGTTDRAKVEQSCREQGFEHTWYGDQKLRLISTHRAVEDHPETREPVWFNHVQVFHLGSAPAEYRRIYGRTGELRILFFWQLSRVLVAAKKLSGSLENAALHATYADGREIPDADLEHLRDVIWKNMVVFPWAKGDVVAIDNRSVAHGRLPYRGEREIVVAWS